MAYQHGVRVVEEATPIMTPVRVDSGLQVAIGVAPIHMSKVKDPLQPQIAFTYKEAKEKMGMSHDLMKYPLCQVTKASFQLYGISPVIYINVLDPETHKAEMEETTLSVLNGKAVLDVDGVLLDTVKIQLEGETLEQDTDYSITFGESGVPVITLLETEVTTKEETAKELKVTGSVVDPSKVKTEDILAGIEKVTDVHPKFGLVPAQLLAPGWSHLPEVYSALISKSRNLNSVFQAFVLSDIDTETVRTYDKVLEAKNKNNITDINSIACYPCVRNGEDVFYYSAVAGAHIAYCDNEKGGGVPFVSPSNKAFRISGLCLQDGTEMILDIEKANFLNGQGICTGLNVGGWKFWGNETAGYPANTDVKDRFIATRRMMIWWGNTFILTYFQKVDDPTNRRLLESVIDSENIRANGFKGQDKIAGASIMLDPEITTQDILDGEIRFFQKIAFYPPAKSIVNILQFDPNALTNAILG